MNQEEVPLHPNIYPTPKVQIQPMDGTMEAPMTAQPQPAQFSPAVPQTKLLLGPSSTVTSCPFCLAPIKTSVKYTSTTRTHIVSFLWCHICCLCCVGCCSDSSKNADHYCPNCKRYLGTYER